MQPRIENPVQSFPGAMEAVLGFAKVASEAAARGGVPPSTVDLVETRASQINGCAVCLDMHTRAAKKHGVTDQQLHTLAAWRDSPYFDEPQRAALALAEAHGLDLPICTMIDRVVRGEIEPMDAYYGLTPAGHENDPG